MRELFAWFWQATPEQKRALLAASFGWMLDSMDVQLYAFVLLDVMNEFQMSPGTGGLLAGLTLLASAAGGLMFGVLADRIGRTRALTASILVYSVFSAACGLSQNVLQLAIFRMFLGFGFGGEWATGAALVAETWPAEHRGKALGVMQSSWAVGSALAASVTAILLPLAGWRGVFFAGILPALVALWIRRRVKEPEIWLRSRAEPGARSGLGLSEIFSDRYRRNTIVATTMNAGTMFAWWGLFTWVPSFLKLPPEQGGAGLTLVDSSLWYIVITAGQFLGYVSFGFIADVLGRRRAYLLFLVVAAAVVPVYGMTREPRLLLLLGPLVGFFGTGYFSGFGAVTAEIFPTRVRATAQGLTYNIGRIASASAPFAVGAMASKYGLGMAFNITAAAFLVSAVLSQMLPETKGKALE